MASKVLVGFANEARNYGFLVVGIDIAGAEFGHPASDHEEAFALAQKCFLKKTVHSGEAFGPPSIYQAITDLHAERIGHGFHLFNLNTSFDENMDHLRRADYIERLTDFIADKRISIEVCLTSNLQTIPELNGDLSLHPFKQMLERNLSVSLCSDNPTVSHTNVLNELSLACDTFGLNLKQLKDIVITGFKRSFMPRAYSKKREYIRKVINYYDALAMEYNCIE
jgi:adenosine deaminase